LENSRTIITEYLLPAVTLFNENNTVLDASEKVETMRTVALFADAEYQRIVKCMNSPDFKAKEAHMREPALVATGKSKDRDTLMAYNVNVKQSQIDKDEIDSINSEKSFFLELALQHYAECLCMSDERVSTVFRVISLILENRTAKADLYRIPSYKFIPVIPQLTPHLKTTKDSFQTLISALLTRLAQDHPHHTLPHILALKFAGLDHEFDDSVKLPANEGRITEAENLIKRLSKGSLQPIIKQMEAVSNAVVQLAYYSNDSSKRMVDIKIPDKLLIKKVIKFDKVQVKTKTQKKLVLCNCVEKKLS
jgi:serine-protein kinase ATM